MLRWRAPIGLVQWTTTANGATTTGRLISDCRPPFLPLTRLRGCCSVTVGDGTTSFGQYSAIQAAVDALPPSGGTVCILPGRYRESVRITRRKNITLHGCGPRSRIEAPATEGDDASALHIDTSSDVVVESLALEGGSGNAVLKVSASAVVRLAECLVQMRDDRAKPSNWPALYVEGTAVEIEHNIIEALPADLPADLQRVCHRHAASERARVADAARVGIQLAGGCEHVRIAGNVIVGGMGNGITLGSIRRFDAQNPDGVDGPDLLIINLCDPCSPADPSVPPDDPNNPVRYASAGDLYDIEIDDNLLDRHGASGISVVRFFSPQLKPLKLALVGVHGLAITRNRITHCLRRATAQQTAPAKFLLGQGGIALALTSALEIEDNLIDDNGRDWLSPVCGIFVLAADGLRIEHNRISRNGMRDEAPLDAAQAGIRAGIHVWLALTLGLGVRAPKAVATTPGAISAAPRQRQLAPQIRVHANQVEQPLGRALLMLGAGAMQITDNLLASRGAGRPATDPIASTVLVANAGLSREWTLGLLMTLAYKLILELYGGTASSTHAQLVCQLSKLSVRTQPLRSRLPTGKLMFNNNQLSFDMKDAPTGLDLASTLLLSLDDVSVCDNQLEHHADRRFLLADLLAAGLSIRSSDNRLAETWGHAIVSGLTLGLMNTAADNQSTHCFKALGLQTAVHHNLALAETFCPDACSSSSSVLTGLVAAGKMARQPTP